MCLDLNRDTKQIIISPVEESLAVAGIDESFAQQVAEFIAVIAPHWKPWRSHAYLTAE